MSLAPIVLFVYNRPDHASITLSTLSNNELSSETNLYIYADYPKSEKDIVVCNEVITVCLSYIKHFKKVEVIKRPYNYGLAKNIHDGVNQAIKKYGKVIVLEDDLSLSPAFLNFMNLALDKYEHESKVWHVSGWTYPIYSRSACDAFFLPVMNCWGWATWEDRWRHFKKEPEKLLRDWSRSDIRRFNLGGTYNFWKQVKLNRTGKMNTWAVFWYASIFKNDGLCLNPSKSYVKNIGLDGSGLNCGSYDPFDSPTNLKFEIVWPVEISQCKKSILKIKFFYIKYKLSIFSRIFSKIRRNL